jgi:hypothetical protein
VHAALVEDGHAQRHRADNRENQRQDDQEPRRPLLDDVDGGFTFGASKAGRDAGPWGVLVNGSLLGFLDEKSGMPRGDFFFIMSSSR